MREKTDVVYTYLPGDLTGLYDHETRTIYIDRRCDVPTQRSTLEHELAHAARGDTCIGIPHLDAKQEETVERIASRRLITLGALLDALPYAHSFAMLAHTLQVDHDMLRKRLTHLDDDEREVVTAWLHEYQEVP